MAQDQSSEVKKFTRLESNELSICSKFALRSFTCSFIVWALAIMSRIANAVANLHKFLDLYAGNCGYYKDVKIVKNFIFN